MNHRLWTVVCLVASVPLVVYLANRRSARPRQVVRFAVLDLGIGRADPAAPARDLRGGGDEIAKRLAAIVQHAQPDVLLLSGFDGVDAAASVNAFATEYLAVPQHGQRAIDYRWRHVAGPAPDPGARAPTDAGHAAADAAPRGLALLSRHPILANRVRTFDRLAWSAMPGAQRPDGLAEAAWAAVPLSSAGHWDLPIGIGDPKAGGRVVHVLCSHPQPVGPQRVSGASGDADAAARRNHDEIRFWVDYLSPGPAEWIVDGGATRGGLAPQDAFVLLGTLGVDPADGPGRRDALAALLAHARVQDPLPRSAGADEASKRQFGANARHGGDAALDTADLDDTPGSGVGNLRLDYVLPSRELAVAHAGVSWPLAREPLAQLAASTPHKLVWVDVALH
jgi:hypothetical protein